MIVFHDYLCSKGHLIEDVAAANHKHIRRSMRCPVCGSRARVYYGQRTKFRSQVRWAWDQTQKGGYGRPGLMYGEVDPQTGVAYENYSHKKKVLKELGLEETGDLNKGSRTDFDDFDSGAPAGRPEGVLVADSLEDITSQIDNDKVDRAATGNPNREGQESWVSFDPNEK